MLSLIPVVLMAPAFGACGSDNGGSREDDHRTPELSAAELTDDLGCGYGFARVNEEGTTLLILWADPDATTTPRTVSFPDSKWNAEVRVGTNLVSNWCTDVIEEPQAEVEETWQVVEGTLTFEGKLPPFRWPEDSQVTQPVVAELTDVVVQGPDGERVDLGDIPLRNESWGFLAG